jgi:hypothetical protein
MVTKANNLWKPIEHSIIRNKDLKKQIHERGFSIQNLIPLTAINELLRLFYQYHTLKDEKGGVFFSVFSQNTDYRKAVHNQISKIVQPIIEPLFQNYKIVINSFVVKLSGPESEFYVHQDTTSLDEWKFSPLSLWIPLHDVDENNGCLGIIPYSKHFFFPYRNISFPAPFDGIQETVKKYLQPVEMKTGEVFLFDNRTLHHSYSNVSGKSRISVICGLFPKDAKVQTCTKPVYEFGGKVEVIEHPDSYLLTGKTFLKNNDKRPETGKSLGWFEDNSFEISAEKFENLCAKFDVKKNILNQSFQPIKCNMIDEPV